MSVIRDRIATLADNFTAGIAADRICDQFIIIDREELPAITLSENPSGEVMIHRNGGEYYAGNGSAWYLEAALGNLAIHEALTEHEASSAERAKDKRRDELALEFTADTRGTLSGACNYSGLLPWTRKMVDRIIELEQAQP